MSRRSLGDGRTVSRTFKLPEALDRAVRARAVLDGVSTGAIVRDAITARLGLDAVKTRAAERRAQRCPDEVHACRTCLGGGRVRDGEALGTRKCLDCDGTGVG